MNEQTEDSWPFDQPRNCASFTTSEVLSGSEPILAVFHDDDDHGWQFIGTTSGNDSNGRVICLSEAVELDSSVLEVADMLPGWHAVRMATGDPWERFKSEN